MLPRLEAREALAAINQAALGAGAGEPLDRERIFAELERKATGTPPPAPVKADPADLAGMGIAVQAADGEAATIADLKGWLDHPSSSAAEGEQERG